MMDEETYKEERKAFIRARRKHIGERVDERFLGYLEERFGTGLPAFQRQAGGGFDPLDAMRRDAYREVVLWLRREWELYTKQHD